MTAKLQLAKDGRQWKGWVIVYRNGRKAFFADKHQAIRNRNTFGGELFRVVATFAEVAS